MIIWALLLPNLSLVIIGEILCFLWLLIIGNSFVKVPWSDFFYVKNLSANIKHQKKKKIIIFHHKCYLVEGAKDDAMPNPTNNLTKWMSSPWRLQKILCAPSNLSALSTALYVYLLLPYIYIFDWPKEQSTWLIWKANQYFDGDK